MVLITVDSSLRAASICDKYKIVLSEWNTLLSSVYPALYGLCYLLAVSHVKYDICDLRVVLECHARRLKILHHRKDQRLILVVLRELEGREIRKS